MKKFPVLAAVTVGLVGVLSAVLLGQSAQGSVVPNAPAAQPPAVVVSAPVEAIDAGDRSLTYQQSGSTVTVSRDGTAIAALTLQKQDWTAGSAHLELQVTVERTFTVDTDRFLVYDVEGGENGVENAHTVRWEPGTHTLVLDFEARNRPAAAGWVPQDGEGGAAVWERTAG
ncbi:hypothetical protein [Actinoplanes derwentensis]|uniref:Uncharacterized protein n=1 Tax=Actinoplanes derwentensis TaxID=113562 RepID=A0A1H2CTH2_9ACTN|nr:hypothetical protein [Actinoplanes derwentensis]GID81848.1 hypothetical protein Ade03nite_07720 [Actinoplanes derwentensis]SDT73840.1 hypothetical protein SAMN04489716_6796 [Actinoplanes derwentensis]